MLPALHARVASEHHLLPRAARARALPVPARRDRRAGEGQRQVAPTQGGGLSDGRRRRGAHRRTRAVGGALCTRVEPGTRRLLLVQPAQHDGAPPRANSLLPPPPWPAPPPPEGKAPVGGRISRWPTHRGSRGGAWLEAWLGARRDAWIGTWIGARIGAWLGAWLGAWASLAAAYLPGATVQP